jgi:RNA polymerase sigma factor (sigma-70 family)
VEITTFQRSDIQPGEISSALLYPPFAASLAHAHPMTVAANRQIGLPGLPSAHPNEGHPYPDDWLLVQRCVAGDFGAQQQLRAILDQFVKGCLRRRGASYTEADDIAGDIAAESLAPRESQFCLLKKYHGTCSFKSWLTRVATNRWIDFKRREAFVVQMPSDENKTSANPLEWIPSQETGDVEEFLLNLLRNCLQFALRACTAEELLRLRLFYLENLSQGEIGKMWGWHGSKVSRELRETMRRIESRTLSRLYFIDPWLTISWDDILNMCAVSAAGQFF